MMNILIAMLSSTYEGVMDIASTGVKRACHMGNSGNISASPPPHLTRSGFRKHRVELVIEMRSRPRCFAGFMYWLEILLIVVGWALRKTRVIKAHNSHCGLLDSRFLDPKDLGWRHRPAFEWQDPEYHMSPRAEKNAKKALATARNQLEEGWDR